jgi:heme exporter protein D
MAEFFSMGGYAAYVWPAYGIAAVILVAMLIVSLRGLRRHEALLKTLETSRPRRRERSRRVPASASGTVPAAEGHEG